MKKINIFDLELKYFLFFYFLVQIVVSYFSFIYNRESLYLKLSNIDIYDDFVYIILIVVFISQILFNIFILSFLSLILTRLYLKFINLHSLDYIEILKLLFLFSFYNIIESGILCYFNLRYLGKFYLSLFFIFLFSMSIGYFLNKKYDKITGLFIFSLLFFIYAISALIILFI